MRLSANRVASTGGIVVPLRQSTVNAAFDCTRNFHITESEIQSSELNAFHCIARKMWTAAIKSWLSIGGF